MRSCAAAEQYLSNHYEEYHRKLAVLYLNYVCACVCVCVTPSSVSFINALFVGLSEKLPVTLKPSPVFLIPLYHRGVYYFNRQSTCSVEQNKHIANFLWGKWKQSFTAKLWLIYYLKPKLYYQGLGFAGGWKAQFTFSWDERKLTLVCISEYLYFVWPRVQFQCPPCDSLLFPHIFFFFSTFPICRWPFEGSSTARYLSTVSTQSVRRKPQ